MFLRSDATRLRNDNSLQRTLSQPPLHRFNHGTFIFDTLVAMPNAGFVYNLNEDDQAVIQAAEGKLFWHKLTGITLGFGCGWFLLGRSRYVQIQKLKALDIQSSRGVIRGRREDSSRLASNQS